MDHQVIVTKLREAVGNSDIEFFPTIGMFSAKSDLTIKLNRPAGALDSDETAFEAWALIFKRWINPKAKVSLDWAEPSCKGAKILLNRHLFKVYMFLRAFPTWFFVVPSKEEALRNFEKELKETRLVVTLPDAEATGDKCKDNETGIEIMFVDCFPNLLKSKTDITDLYRQLPVGIFKENVGKYNVFLPDKRASVDLWGINKVKKKLNIFELKYYNGSTVKIGALSQLFYYLCVVNELLVKKDGLLELPDNRKVTKKRGADVLYEHIKEYKRLRGYLLVDKLHPLLDDKVFDLLNEGLKNMGEDVKVEKLIYSKENASLALVD